MQETSIRDPRGIMIYLGDSGTGSPCSSPLECARACDIYPERCQSPKDKSLELSDGIWSGLQRHNPFASYFKVVLTRSTLLNSRRHFTKAKYELPFRYTSHHAAWMNSAAPEVQFPPGRLELNSTFTAGTSSALC